jgi:hypothetical protein
LDFAQTEKRIYFVQRTERFGDFGRLGNSLVAGKCSGCAVIAGFSEKHIFK